MKGTGRLPLVLIGLFLCAALLASAQNIFAQTTATVGGTVKDQTGGVLPGATISVTNTQTGVSREAVTDSDGRYLVTNLVIGDYEVTANMSGFQPVVRRGIELTIGRAATVDFALSLGQVTESVTVAGEAPLVDTRSGSLGGIVDRETILEIPLNGRDLTGLITMQAGTAMATSASDGTSQGFSHKFSIGGARPGDNSILLDGTEVKSSDGGVPAGVSGNFMGGEAIQEFKVERNAYSAQQGGSAGGIINVVSKSGTNTFHGSVYGFTRNDALDAANFRAPAILDSSGKFIGKDKPDFWRAQYGASAGGRILENRTFYFANFEGMRERLGLTNFVTTLSARARQGILPSGNVVVNQAVVPYLALWPLPADAVDLGDGTARYSVNQNQPTDEDFFQLRVDHNLSNADAFFARITRQLSEQHTPGAIERWSDTTRVYNTFLTVEERKILTSNLLNTFRFGFNRRGIGAETDESPRVDTSLLMVPPDKWTLKGITPGLGSIGVSGLTGVGAGRGWADRATNLYQYIDDLEYNRGSHSIKVGFSWLHTLLGGHNPSRPGGAVSFGSIASFLRGQPTQFRGDILPETNSFRYLNWNVVGSYVQDDWRVSNRLTLNLGLRHEFYTVPTERDGKLANIKDPQHDTSINVLGARGDRWYENPSAKSFAPRLGMAWQPTGSPKMAIRAGVGLFYNHIQPEAFRAAAWRMAPYALETDITAVEGVIPFPNGLYDYIVGLGQAAAAVQTFRYHETNNPRLFQWNVNLQRELMSQMSITVGYAGSRGQYLPNDINANTARADLINGRYVFPVGATRSNPAFPTLDLRIRENRLNSWYNALQIEMQRRFSGGWMLATNYTYSRSVDDASSFTPTFSADGGGVIYYWDQNLRRALSAFDVRNTFSMTGVWMLPIGGDQGLSQLLLGGWQLSGQLTVADGSPLTISMSSRSNLSSLGLGSDFPDLIDGGNNNPVTGNPDAYFDVQQFVWAPPRTIGNLGRNTLIGPGVATVNLGLTKNVALPGRSRVQFRLETFNLLNRPNLGLPSRSLFNGSGNRTAGAGFIGSTATTARQIQLGLRVDW